MLAKTTLIAATLFVTLAGAARAASPVKAVNAFPKLRFTNPLLLTYPPDGSDRLFVVEQPGRVLWFENDPGVTETHVAIDARSMIRAGGEEGLLGFAFHPKFKENHRVFLLYTPRDMPRRDLLAAFRMDDKGQAIDPKSREILLEVREPWANHNGGMIAFGPDGYLYLALGDGGSAGDPRDAAQNLASPLGKIFRIDVDHPDTATQPARPYAIPKDNPFLDHPLPEIYAYGLRNPWRFSFDRRDGTLWAGDVGQDKWEEIDIIKKGGNYGWHIREGMHDFKVPAGGKPSGLIDPVVEHSHREAKSITGGYVYRGSKIPALAGQYIYGDYVTGLIWGFSAADAAAGKPVTPAYLAQVPAISSFGEDRDGEVYVVSLGGWIYRFEPAE
jgi:glucose/arabinose dehydrogenase